MAADILLSSPSLFCSGAHFSADAPAPKTAVTYLAKSKTPKMSNPSNGGYVSSHFSSFHDHEVCETVSKNEFLRVHAVFLVSTCERVHLNALQCVNQVCLFVCGIIYMHECQGM